MVVAVRLEIFALRPFPLVKQGDDLAVLVISALERCEISLEDGDVLVLAQKIVSKAEGRYVDLSEIEPTEEAKKLAKQTGKDPRLVETILSESRYVVRAREGLIIVRHRLGFVHANAGVDRSNIENADKRVLLLPVDPDGSAEDLRNKLSLASGKALGVVINDSFGRPWRIGTVGVAIGVAGINPIYDQIGAFDLYNRKLESTISATADEIAAAASLVMGQAAEACPAVLIRGLPFRQSDCGSTPLIRSIEMDLFQ